MSRREDPMDDTVVEEALRWHAATLRPDCDWMAFTAWLEAAPLHRQAYDQVALLEQQLARHRAALRPLAVERAIARPSRRIWQRAAIAAGVVLVAVLGMQMAWPPTAGTEQVFVAASVADRLSLEGGVTVVLAPGSRLVATGPRDTQLSLQGTAYFDVPHDPSRELVIAAGPYAVRDIGTRFEVMSDGSQLKVAVAEGQVSVLLPGGAPPVAVAASHRLLVAGDPPIAEYGQVEAAELASWRAGRLVFRNEPLSMVASQVGRHAGLIVTVDPAIAQRRFSGVLAIGDGSRLVAELGQIMGLRAERDAAGVRLVAADDGSPGR